MRRDTKMRPGTKQKLDKMTARERWQISLGLAGTVVAAAAVAYFGSPLTMLEARNVDAVVTFARTESDTETGRAFTNIQARLAHGGMVTATGLPQMPPRIGDRIILEERRYLLTGMSYRWHGARPIIP